MATTTITPEDLQVFKHELIRELIEEIKPLLPVRQPKLSPGRWLKSYEVKKLLNISHGTLQVYRSKGILPFTRIGGLMYYDSQDIEKLLQERKQNGEQSDSTLLWKA